MSWKQFSTVMLFGLTVVGVMYLAFDTWFYWESRAATVAIVFTWTALAVVVFFFTVGVMFSLKWLRLWLIKQKVQRIRGVLEVLCNLSTSPVPEKLEPAPDPALDVDQLITDIFREAKNK